MIMVIVKFEYIVAFDDYSLSSNVSHMGGKTGGLSNGLQRVCFCLFGVFMLG